MKLLYSICLFVIVSFSSCIIERPTYYVSPFNGNSTAYHTMPLKKDSIKTATYTGGNLYFGRANTNQTDKVIHFEGNIYQAKQFGIFQAYYGANAGFGNYKVAPFDTATDYTTANWKALNAMAGNKFYGSIGAEGGINLVHVTRHGEWRIIGTELSTHHELGSYAKFRKNLPDNAANLIIRSPNFSTVGFNTETVRKTNHGSYSLQFAYGFVLGKSYSRVEALNYLTQIPEHINYNYSTLTFQYTYAKWTGYLQSTGAAYASGVRIGGVYHLR